MTLPLVPFWQWPTRRDKILALAKNLHDARELIDLRKIDGEFYWRICRDDLLEPDIQLESDETSGQFDPMQRRDIDQFTKSLEEVYKLDEFEQRPLVDRFKETLQIRAALRTRDPRMDQLPDFVWSRFVAGRHLVLSLEVSSSITGDVSAVEIQVDSRSMSGTDIEESIGSLKEWGLWDIVNEEYERQEVGTNLHSKSPADKGSSFSLQMTFTLVTEPPASSPSELYERIYAYPFVAIRLPPPLPPEGVVGCAYNAIVRNQHQWHLLLPGAEVPHDKVVAIRTWAIGLLMREGDSFSKAVHALESATGYMGLSQKADEGFSQEADRQARNRLFERVPAARSYLGPR